MILRSLEVAHWRSLLRKVSVGPFGEGINIIHAPNGTGKSSLFEALRRSFFDAYHVTGKEIERIRPWGRDLAPRVTIDFTHRNDSYRLEKGFLEGAFSRLARQEEGAWQPFAEGKQADGRLRDLLVAANGPKRGLSRPEHWGLYQVLWAPQGGLALGELAADVDAALREGFGGKLESGAGSRLDQLLADAYSRYYTGGGKLRRGKDGAPLELWQEQLGELQVRREELLEKQRLFEETARRVEDSRARRQQLSRESQELKKTLSETRGAAESWATLTKEYDYLSQKAQVASERFEEVSKRIRSLEEDRRQLGQLDEKVAPLNERLQQSDKELAAEKARERESRVALEQARESRKSLAEARTALEMAREEINDRDRLRELSVLFDKLEALEAEQNALRETLRNLLAPSVEEMKVIRQAVSERDKVHAAYEASLIHLTIKPLKGTTVRAEDEAPQNLRPGEEGRFVGRSKVSVEIDEFGTIDAVGPSGSRDDLPELVADADARVAHVTAAFGQSDPEQLQARCDEAQRLQVRLEQGLNTMEELLGGTDRRQFEAERDRLRNRQQVRYEKYPEFQKSLPVLSQFQEQYEKREQEVESQIGLAEAHYATAGRAVQEVELERERLAGDLRVLTGERDALLRRLDSSEKKHESNEDRERLRRETLMAWEAARAKAEACEKNREALSPQAPEALAQLERQLAGLEESERQARDDENQALGRLQALVAEGVYSQLVATEEQLEVLETRVAREQRRMDGLQLLYQTVVECRADLSSNLLAPLNAKVSRLLHRVMGDRVGEVAVSDAFGLDGVRPRSVDEVVPAESLSAGEREQLQLVLRLALADVLAKEERELVVLDDVLNASDIGRLMRLLPLLEEAAQKLQIVFLTCHPERYRGLTNAQFFDLESLVAKTREE